MCYQASPSLTRLVNPSPGAPQFPHLCNGGNKPGGARLHPLSWQLLTQTGATEAHAPSAWMVFCQQSEPRLFDPGHGLSHHRASSRGTERKEGVTLTAPGGLPAILSKSRLLPVPCAHFNWHGQRSLINHTAHTQFHILMKAACAAFFILPASQPRPCGQALTKVLTAIKQSHFM